MALDLFSCMKSFVTVAEMNGFAPAARKLHLSPPVLTKQIQHLEHLLKKTLFERTTRRIELTEAGQIYLPEAASILNAVQHAENTMHALETEPHGLLILGASGLLNTPRFAQHLTNFLKKYPKINLQVQTEISPQSVLEGQLHLSITEENFFDTGLIKEEIMSIHRKIYATPAYLQEFGVPKTLAELQNHNCLIFQKSSPTGEWTLGKYKKIKPVSRYSTDSNTHFMLMLTAGFGLGWCYEHLVEKELEAGILQEVPLITPLPPLPIFMYYRPHSHNPALKQFVSYLTKPFPHTILN